MTDETYVNRSVLRDAGADEEWFRTHMPGRGRLALSKVITCAPRLFSIYTFDESFTGVVRYADGTRMWYRNGRYHREDGPAAEYANGTRMWYCAGRRHREDGPAIEHADGTLEWYCDGRLHREDGPAVEYADGTLEWYCAGRLHREDGPAIEYADGTRMWYRNGKKYIDELSWKASA